MCHDQQFILFSFHILKKYFLNLPTSTAKIYFLPLSSVTFSYVLPTTQTLQAIVIYS